MTDYELAESSYMLENDHYNTAAREVGSSQKALRKTFPQPARQSIATQDQKLNYGSLGKTEKEPGYEQFDHKLQPLLYFMKDGTNGFATKKSLSPSQHSQHSNVLQFVGDSAFNQRKFSDPAVIFAARDRKIRMQKAHEMLLKKASLTDSRNEGYVTKLIRNEDYASSIEFQEQELQKKARLTIISLYQKENDLKQEQSQLQSGHNRSYSVQNLLPSPQYIQPSLQPPGTINTPFRSSIQKISHSIQPISLANDYSRATLKTISTQQQLQSSFPEIRSTLKMDFSKLKKDEAHQTKATALNANYFLRPLPQKRFVEQTLRLQEKIRRKEILRQTKQQAPEQRLPVHISIKAQIECEESFKEDHSLFQKIKIPSPDRQTRQSRYYSVENQTGSLVSSQQDRENEYAPQKTDRAIGVQADLKLSIDSNELHQVSYAELQNLGNATPDEVNVQKFSEKPFEFPSIHNNNQNQDQQKQVVEVQKAEQRIAYVGDTTISGENFGSLDGTAFSHFEVQAFSLAQARYSSNSRMNQSLRARQQVIKEMHRSSGSSIRDQQEQNKALAVNSKPLHGQRVTLTFKQATLKQHDSRGSQSKRRRSKKMSTRQKNSTKNLPAVNRMPSDLTLRNSTEESGRMKRQGSRSIRVANLPEPGKHPLNIVSRANSDVDTETMHAMQASYMGLSQAGATQNAQQQHILHNTTMIDVKPLGNAQRMLNTMQKTTTLTMNDLQDMLSKENANKQMMHAQIGMAPSTNFNSHPIEKDGGINIHNPITNIITQDYSNERMDMALQSVVATDPLGSVLNTIDEENRVVEDEYQNSLQQFHSMTTELNDMISRHSQEWNEGDLPQSKTADEVIMSTGQSDQHGSHKSLNSADVRSHKELQNLGVPNNTEAQSLAPMKQASQTITQADDLEPSSQQHITDRSSQAANVIYDAELYNIEQKRNPIGKKRIIKLKKGSGLNSSQHQSSADLMESRQSNHKFGQVAVKDGRPFQSPTNTNDHNSRTAQGMTASATKVSLAIKDNGSIQMTINDTDMTRREGVNVKPRKIQQKHSELSIKKINSTGISTAQRQSQHVDQSDGKITGVLESMPTNRSLDSDNKPKKVSIQIRKSDDKSLQETAALQKLAGMIQQTQNSEEMIIIAAQESENSLQQYYQKTSNLREEENNADQIYFHKDAANDKVQQPQQSPKLFGKRQQSLLSQKSKQSRYDMQQSANSTQMKKLMARSPRNQTLNDIRGVAMHPYQTLKGESLKDKGTFMRESGTLNEPTIVVAEQIDTEYYASLAMNDEQWIHQRDSYPVRATLRADKSIPTKQVRQKKNKMQIQSKIDLTSLLHIQAAQRPQETTQFICKDYQTQPQQMANSQIELIVNVSGPNSITRNKSQSTAGGDVQYMSGEAPLKIEQPSVGEMKTLKLMRKRSIQLQQQQDYLSQEENTIGSQLYPETVIGDERDDLNESVKSMRHAGSSPIKKRGDTDDSVSPYQQSLLNLYTSQVQQELEQPRMSIAGTNQTSQNEQERTEELSMTLRKEPHIVANHNPSQSLASMGDKLSQMTQHYKFPAPMPRGSSSLDQSISRNISSVEICDRASADTISAYHCSVERLGATAQTSPDFGLIDRNTKHKLRSSSNSRDLFAVQVDSARKIGNKLGVVVREQNVAPQEQQLGFGLVPVNEGQQQQSRESLQGEEANYQESSPLYNTTVIRPKVSKYLARQRNTQMVRDQIKQKRKNNF